MLIDQLAKASRAFVQDVGGPTRRQLIWADTIQGEMGRATPVANLGLEAMILNFIPFASFVPFCFAHSSYVPQGQHRIYITFL